MTALAAVLIAAAALSKYYGMALIPLLIVYTLVRQRRLGWWAAYLLIPVAALGWYQTTTNAMYTRGLLTDAASYATTWRFGRGALVLQKLFVGLAFSGGCLASALFYAPAIWLRRHLLAGIGLAAATAVALVSLRSVGSYALTSASGGLRWVEIAELSVFVAAGIGLVALCVSDLLRRRDADSALLVLWVLGTLAFASLINWSVNGRSILPAAPAIGILVVRRLEMLGKPAEGARSRWVLAPLIPAAVLALWVTYADYTLAGAQRTAAREVLARYAGGDCMVFTEGHWGFQDHMRAGGAVDVDLIESHVRPGDVVAAPNHNTNLVDLPWQDFDRREPVRVPVTCLMATMRSAMGAGFYADTFGPLPFVAGQAPEQKVDIYVARRNLDIDHAKVYAGE